MAILVSQIQCVELRAGDIKFASKLSLHVKERPDGTDYIIQTVTSMAGVLDAMAEAKAAPVVHVAVVNTSPKAWRAQYRAFYDLQERFRTDSRFHFIDQYPDYTEEFIAYPDLSRILSPTGTQRSACTRRIHLPPL